MPAKKIAAACKGVLGSNMLDQDELPMSSGLISHTICNMMICSGHPRMLEAKT